MFQRFGLQSLQFMNVASWEYGRCEQSEMNSVAKELAVTLAAWFGRISG
ncbi:MAG: hypothetical protein NTU79_17845 [Planctomycetota bacterium]|nr:hypothetical protein [Planctomycetota bacterium]